MNDEGLEVGRALGEQLASMDSRTSDNRGVIADTSTEDSVVRGLVARAEEVVSDSTDIDLYEVSVKEHTARRGIPYGSERENPAELVSNILVHDVPHSVVLVEVSRTLRNVDVGRDNAASGRTGDELVSNVDQVVKSSRVSAVYGAASGTLEVVKTTTWLTTGSPHTTIGSRHDNVRE